MKEEIRERRMQEHGCITYCEKENTMCFGCLTEDGECKYEVCLHNNPEWIEQQKRIEAKRNQIIKPESVSEPAKVERPKAESEVEKLMKSIHRLEERANALYKAGERKEAERLMNISRRQRRRLWEAEHK